MKEKLNCILLIDDNGSTNFLHQLMIKKANCAEKCVAVQSGQEALDYLESSINGIHPQPDLIFLDINMPSMNGWEFLEHYKKLKKDQQGKIVVMMLTTSRNLDDIEKSKRFGYVSGFMNKPLTADVLLKVVQEKFPKNF
ncbi:Response regulator rcp1 [Polaribacter huanghezhanensis]|uniref:response regulator n=1 Tax=Polaribacter huanghezhanensis TaxID=1354726 RepID=UPI0026491890|nr:response regulator [Polaribacter huanghezhanensis]WKD85316.1 Response regulator rcp1 [Polaribacter huanghezhanensis]